MGVGSDPDGTELTHFGSPSSTMTAAQPALAKTAKARKLKRVDCGQHPSVQFVRTPQPGANATCATFET